MDSTSPSIQLYSHFFAPVIKEIVWFDVSVNDSKLVDVSQSLQQVVDIESDFFEAHWANDVLTIVILRGVVSEHRETVIESSLQPLRDKNHTTTAWCSM